MLFFKILIILGENVQKNNCFVYIIAVDFNSVKVLKYLCTVRAPNAADEDVD